MADHLDRCEATGKVCYTFVEATKQARFRRRHRKPEDKVGPCSAYSCRSCGWSHYGHHPESIGKRKRRMQR